MNLITTTPEYNAIRLFPVRKMRHSTVLLHMAQGVHLHRTHVQASTQKWTLRAEFQNSGAPTGDAGASAKVAAHSTSFPDMLVRHPAG